MSCFTSWKSASDDFDFGQQPSLDLPTDGIKQDGQKMPKLPTNIIVENRSKTKDIKDLEDLVKQELIESLNRDIQDIEDIEMKAKPGDKMHGTSKPINKETIKGELLKAKRNKGGKKSLFCDRCTFAARRNSDLEQHIRQHHDKIKLACDQCMYKTFYTHILRRHIQIVHDGIPLSCSQCDFKVNKLG